MNVPFQQLKDLAANISSAIQGIPNVDLQKDVLDEIKALQSCNELETLLSLKLPGYRRQFSADDLRAESIDTDYFTVGELDEILQKEKVAASGKIFLPPYQSNLEINVAQTIQFTLCARCAALHCNCPNCSEQNNQG